MRKLWPLCLLMLVLLSCRREEEIIVPDNTAPPDSTISDIVLESYVNRSYIILLGARATDAQVSQGVTTLRAHDVSLADRDAFLSGIMTGTAYENRRFAVERSVLLSSVDTTAIREELTLINYILSDSQYITLWPQAQFEKGRYEELLAIPTDLGAGTIDMKEAHRRMVYNRIYDEINMGTQNFVISMFQNFLSRYPTEAERTASEIMVDGFPSQIFLMNGDSKTEFIDIFLNSDDYVEGQVRILFARYLYRTPTTQEMENMTILYRNNDDYKALQKAIMSLDEFVGL